MGGGDGGNFGWKGRPVESEEDCTEEGRGLFTRVGFELRLDVNDECRADGRE